MKTIEYKIDKIVEILSTKNENGYGNNDGEILAFCGEIIFKFDHLTLNYKSLEDLKDNYSVTVWKSKSQKFRRVPSGIVMELSYHGSYYTTCTGRGSCGQELNILNKKQFQEWKESIVERLM